MSKKDDDIILEAVEFFKLSADAEKDNRERGIVALEFAQGGDSQWDENVLRTRRLPGKVRPSESYNQLPNFINQVANDARMNMSQTKFVADDDGDKETAQKMEDVAREIQTRSDAEVAYDTAFYGQVVGGWGYWRYETAYQDETSFDQIIKVKAIDNPFMVYDDPFVTTATQLDRRMLIEASMMPRKEFNKQFDEKYDDFDCASIGDKFPGWGSKESIRVAEYWKRTEVKKTIWKNKKTGEIVKEEPEDKEAYDSRETCDYKVKWYLLTADKILDSKDWPGKYIPYVKVVGHEVNINGTVKISGMVERLIPAQKQMNYFTNAAVEAMAIAPLSPWIADPVAIAPYQEIWDSANIVNYSYLPADTYDTDGRQLAAPRRNDNGANLSGYVAMVQMSQQNFYNLSGIFPASLGQASNEKSGKAILARQKEGDVSTFHLHDNLARGQRTGGIIMGDLIPLIYDGTRWVDTKQADGTHKMVQINKPYKTENGKTVNYDFTKGKYKPIITTGPSYTTKRAEAADSQIQLAQAYPEIMQIAGSDIVRNFEWPGADVISDKLKILEETKFPQLAAKENEDLPPRVQAQMQQMQQVIEQVTGEAQQMQAELESKKVEDQSKMADVQLRAKELSLTEQKAAMDYQIEQEKIKLEYDKNQRDYDIERMKLQQQPIMQAPNFDDEGVMLASIDALRRKKETEMMQSQVQEQKEQEASQIDQQFKTALIEGIAGVQSMLAATAQATQAQTQATQMQTQAIMAPVSMMRDPKTNLATGAVKVLN